MDGSQGSKGLAVGTGTSQAKGSDLLWYWWLALQHRYSQCSGNTLPTAAERLPKGRGEIAGGTLHMGITGLNKLDKNQMIQAQFRTELFSYGTQAG